MRGKERQRNTPKQTKNRLKTCQKCILPSSNQNNFKITTK